MAERLQEVLSDARDELVQHIKDGYPGDDQIHEIADNAVPVYNDDLITFVVENDLYMNEPEIKYGNAGNNLIGICQGIVYEEVSNYLSGEVQGIEEQIEDLNTQISDLESEIEELEERIEELDDAGESEDLAEKLESLEEDLRSVKDELEAV